MTKINIFRIKTTAYELEDFFLLTDLPEEKIIQVIEPIVQAERDGYQEYESETLYDALVEKYPNRLIEMFVDFDEIKI
jgi:hypothetical protein